MKVFVATKNPGKLEELRAIFSESELELITYPQYKDPVEGESSYAKNAALKACALRDQLRLADLHAAVLADDSGLEVAALHGRPGVLSARYLGSDAPWHARREALLEELRGVPEEARAAKFCCAIALILEDGRELSAYGQVQGVIADHERGEFGFGYDPIFFYPPAGLTFAELSEREKNLVSHRRVAAGSLLNALRMHA